jgi:hypothetical protein
MVHARRKFIAVVKVRKKARGNKASTKGLADEALDYIKELYHIEKYVRHNELTVEQIRELRREKSKPILDRFKNWLFAGGPNGAEASATFLSLIETAKANGLEPYAYLRYLFEKSPSARTEADYRDLLPNRIDKADIDAVAVSVVE